MVVPVKFSCGFVANIWLEICFNTMSLRANLGNKGILIILLVVGSLKLLPIK